MLNPSTADETQDDPTIRRCIGFAKSWGFGKLAVANLFAFRSKSPRDLKAMSNPIGEENDLWLRKLQDDSSLTVAAWGNSGSLHGRGSSVRSILSDPHTLGLTQNGQPKHPLYVLGATQPSRWG